MGKLIGSLVFTVLIIMTLNDMESMKNIFNFYSWLVIVLGGIAGLFLLGVSVVSTEQEMFTAVTDKLTWESASLWVLSYSLTGYLMHSYDMGIQLLLYVISCSMYCLSVLICTIRK